MAREVREAQGPSSVIASEAKQSNAGSQVMDCFVASLLEDGLTTFHLQLPLVRRIIRLIDGELVHRGLPQMLR